jgi:hypothetical protein
LDALADEAKVLRLLESLGVSLPADLPARLRPKGRRRYGIGHDTRAVPRGRFMSVLPSSLPTGQGDLWWRGSDGRSRLECEMLHTADLGNELESPRPRWLRQRTNWPR